MKCDVQDDKGVKKPFLRKSSHLILTSNTVCETEHVRNNKCLPTLQDSNTVSRKNIPTRTYYDAFIVVHKASEAEHYRNVRPQHLQQGWNVVKCFGNQEQDGVETVGHCKASNSTKSEYGRRPCVDSLQLSCICTVSWRLEMTHGLLWVLTCGMI